MAFHDKLAYFTGYKYEPDPQPDDDAVMVEPEAVDELQSIVETIVREKAEQAPEDQAATAEGDTTFSDLMEQHEEAVDAEPEPMPSALDDVPADMALEGMPIDRLMEPGGEELEPEGESDDWLTEMGLAGDGDPEEAIEGQGQGGVSLEKALLGQPEEVDRLGLDGMFAPGAPDEADEALADMFGGEPGYEDLVGEALGDDGLGAEGPLEIPDTFEEAEDLLPDAEEDIAGPPSAEYGDRGLLKSILMAEGKAAAAARRVLASDVTININIGDESDSEPELELEEPELEGLGEELGEADLGESDLGEGLEEPVEPEGLDELEGDLGEEEVNFGDLGEEATAAVRRVLAKDVTININIGDGEEVDIQAPEDIEGEPIDEDFGFDEDLGKDLGLEDLDEGLGEEEGFGEELAPAKKGEGETFDELDDIADVFGDEESVGDKDDEIQEFGI